MTAIRIPSGSKDAKNRLHFEVENAAGEICEFSIPKRGYYTRAQIRALDAAGAEQAKKKPKLSPSDELVEMVAMVVDQIDPEAAKFLRGDGIENQQIEAIWEAYTAVEDGDVTEGESAASSAS